jgi:uncharacterized protein YjcR
MWKEKESIVYEAYELKSNIKPTANKYNVSPAQICQWKLKLDGFVLTKWHQMMSLKMIQMEGHKSKLAGMMS